MSYDLFLRPRKVAIGKKDFEAYFQDRRFYDAEAGHAAYSNEETKAYFSFEWVDARDDEEGELYPIAFNINYFRPSYFIMEAEIEVSALVGAFDLVVDDPQWKGMGKGEYDAEVLMSGWNAGNESAYDIFLETPEQRSHLRTLPSATVLQAWRWNFERDARQQSVGDTKFVPRIQFLEVEGQMTSAMVWPDGVPLVAAPVDRFILTGENLLRRRPDLTKARRLLPWAEAIQILAPFIKQAPGPVVTFDYDEMPSEVLDLLLRRSSEPVSSTIWPQDRVLDREIVERALERLPRNSR
ncbi:hypothetical protein [Reyranella sp.]|uniref:hypothetical protein n=1 Tax=Reyranella sp. TaxID=1929291 RepID=UPI000BD7E7BE|nr:hypothetical protein [Reyranella sp.]OYY44085.1 MAG: hypothetical protein B7Y57_07865 [Rhodospirillales bacterium 35-66-84]OYZ94761.1 MAG: hypothetical protein B7Y08_10745 [Rhodospirillales bacterium 24-66-33]OZB26164.1 MAG: hypothetical protein B7X63_09465 [Rhodospirillales bacterium 39-66-50]HQS15125.1 hypothetical protein [Reyranella sp.]HQT10934.1 hypothetical protein [Reyranella sp.]